MNTFRQNFIWNLKVFIEGNALNMSSTKCRPFCSGLNVIMFLLPAVFADIGSTVAHWCRVTHMRRWSSLDQTMAYCLFGTKLFSEPMLTYRQTDHKEHISMKFCPCIEENAFENVVGEMSAIFSRPQCVNGMRITSDQTLTLGEARSRLAVNGFPNKFIVPI